MGIGIIELAILGGGVFLLVHRRTRPVGIVLAVLLLGGVLYMSMRSVDRTQPAEQAEVHWQAAAQRQALHDALASQQQALRDRMEAQRQAVHETLIAQADALAAQHAAASENQRPSRPPEAHELDADSDGNMNVYPDEAYVQHFPNGASRSTRTSVKVWILFAPLLALVAGFTAMWRHRRSGGGWGAALSILGVMALLLVGMMFWGRISYRTQSHPIYVLNSHDAIGAPAEQYPRVIHPDVAEQESIDAIWARLTEPRIQLEQSLSDLGKSMPGAEPADRELADAAREVLSASVPGADPFTQGWLVSAAKAILEASADKSLALPAVAMPADDRLTVVADQEDLDNRRPPAAQAKKPAWVTSPPGLVGNVRGFTLSTGPYVTVEECHRELERQMRDLLAARITEMAQEASGNPFAKAPPIEELGFGTAYILREHCKGEFVESVEASVGEMKKAYALLEFSEAQDEMLLDRWKSHARRAGISNVAAVAGMMFGGLALAYGLLTVDTWTRGYYTKRLFLGVPAVIIAVIGLMAFIFIP